MGCDSAKDKDPESGLSVAIGALTLDDVDALMKMVKGNEIEELEIEGKDLKIRICGGRREDKSPPPPTYAVAAPAMALPLASPSLAPAEAPSADAAQSGISEAPVEGDGADEAAAHVDVTEIKAPMVGTFYLAPAPDAPPYVEVGDRVTEDTVLCIVEAMKLMNEIKAETSGIISKVLIENGQPVEFGQPMFLVESSE